MKTINRLTLFILVSIIFSFSAFPSYSAEENTCVACHGDVKKPAKSVHAAMKMGCSACHASVEGKSHPDQKGSIVLTQKIPGLCYGCHDESKFKGKSGHTLLGMCTGCHRPHRSDTEKLLNSEQPGVCYDCHERAKFTRKYLHKIINVGGCSSCHAPHISNYPSLLVNNERELCISCHAAKMKLPHVAALPGKRRHPIDGVIDPSTVKMISMPDPANPKKKIMAPDPNVPGKEMTCASCHDPHSSDFKGLLTQARICTKCHKK
jgi:predicted CXXCH cytochrome family protein